MTATADILTAIRRNALLVPNAALRFTPAGWTGSSGGVASALTPKPPKRGTGGFGVAGQDKTATIGRGSRQTVYVLDGDKPKAIAVTIGDSNGSLTVVSSADLKPGMKVITGRLARTGE